MIGRIYVDKSGRWVVGYYTGVTAGSWASFDFATEAEAVAKAKAVGITRYFVGYTDVLKEVA